MKHVLPLLLVIFLACFNPTNNEERTIPTAAEADSSYVWKKLLDSADWRKSYNFEMFSVHDTLWTFRQDGIWFSADIYTIDSMQHEDFDCFSRVVREAGNCPVNERYNSALSLTVSFLEDQLKNEHNFQPTVDNMIHKNLRRKLIQ